jgi:hypothetical protein
MLPPIHCAAGRHHITNFDAESARHAAQLSEPNSGNDKPGDDVMAVSQNGVAHVS